MKNHEIKELIKKYLLPNFETMGYKLYRDKDLIKINQHVLSGIISKLNDDGDISFSTLIVPLTINNVTSHISFARNIKFDEVTELYSKVTVENYEFEELFNYFTANINKYFIPWLEDRNTPEKIIAHSVKEPTESIWLQKNRELYLIHSYAQIGDLKNLIDNGTKILDSIYKHVSYDYEQREKSEVQELVRLAEKNDRAGIEKILKASIENNIKLFKLEDYI